MSRRWIGLVLLCVVIPHLPFAGGSVTAANAARFQRTRFVKQISRDSLIGPPGSEDDTQVEAHVAIDANDPSIVVAVFQQGRFPDGGSAAPGYATSHDGGRSWTTGSLPGLTEAVGGAFERGTDPVVAFGPDGAVYAQTLLVTVSRCRSAVAVQRSDDGGLTWGAPVLVQDDSTCSHGGPLNDKNWIAVDAFPGSPHHGRIYSAWTTGDQVAVTRPVVLRHSDDRGTTWSALVTPSSIPTLTSGVGVVPVVQPNGDVTLVYNFGSRPPFSQVSQTSHDGGEHFDPQVMIATDHSEGVPSMRTAFGLPSATADPVTGYLYAAWQDTRFGADGLNDIVMTRSTDGGVSWESPRLVNSHTSAGRRHFFTPAVAAHGGAVHVTYASVRVRHGVRRDKVDLRYALSNDGGVSFRRDRRLGRLGDLDFAAFAILGGVKVAFLGDYMGLAASANVVHAAWCLPLPKSGSPRSPHQVTWGATIEG